jgi:hypothetical protein
MLDGGSMNLWSYGGPRKFVTYLKLVCEKLEDNIYFLELYREQHLILAQEKGELEWLDSLICSLKAAQATEEKKTERPSNVVELRPAA